MKCSATAVLVNLRSVIAAIPYLLLLVAVSAGKLAHAEGVSLILNGKSFHQDQPKKGNFNENNWGFGVQYDFRQHRENWTPYLTASGFKDSFKENSYYAGGGLMREFTLSSIHPDLYFGAGAVGFVMVRKDHHNRRPFLGALPAFTLGTKRFAINASNVPEVEPKLVPLWFIQLKIGLGQF